MAGIAAGIVFGVLVRTLLSLGFCCACRAFSVGDGVEAGGFDKTVPNAISVRKKNAISACFIRPCPC